MVTYTILPLSFLGENGWKIGSALAARHIGGAINFVSVCETLNVDDGSIVSAAIAADNVVVALYFAFLFYLAIPGEDGDSDKKVINESENGRGEGVVSKGEGTEVEKEEKITIQSLAVSITMASCLVTLGKIISKVALPVGTSVSIMKMINVSFLVLMSIFAFFLAHFQFVILNTNLLLVWKYK